MIYPRIHSFSTVGIRRHYNQDYFLDELRTDFVGDNGSGKSMIADLMQIIFIPDRKLFKFGTKPVKPRTIETIPHPDVKEAYVFLNIEIAESTFIIIGVCIPSRNTVEIKPFIIVKDVDYENKSIGELAFDKSQLLYSKDFVINNTLMGISELSINFKKRFQLFLIPFDGKVKRQNYFQFLFRREILPINLEITDNYEAFAKVLQSFAKAETLNLNNQNSLKDFLFEDSSQLIHQEYKNQKDDLMMILLRYNNFSNQILDLENRQKQVGELKQAKNDRDDSHFENLRGEISKLSLDLKKEELEQKNFTEKLSIDKKRLEDLLIFQRHIPEILKNAKETYESESTRIRILLEDASKFNELFEFKENLKNLESIELFENENFESNSNLELKFALDKLKIFECFKPRFNEISAIENERKLQYDSLISQRKNASDSITSLKELQNIITNKSENSVFNKVLSEGKALSPKQETVLFYLLDFLRFNKPSSDVKKGIRYIENLLFLEEDNIIEDKHNNGFWLELGKMKEFIPSVSKEMILGDAETIQQASDSILSDMIIQIATHQKAINELDKIEKGNNYDQKIINKDYNIELFKVTPKEIQEVKLILGSYHSILIESKNKIENNIISLRTKHPFYEFEGSTSEKHLSFLEELKSQEIIFKQKFEKLNEEKDSTQLSISELDKKIALDKVDSDNRQQSIEKIKVEIDFKTTEISINFKERQFSILEQISEELLTILTKKYKDNDEKYIEDYKTIVKPYRGNDELRNTDIIIQIEEKTYDFDVLERLILFGIGHLEEVPERLRQLNSDRHITLNNIQDKMIKVFSKTKEKYKDYEQIVDDLNDFFKGRKINDIFYFEIEFKKSLIKSINWIDNMINEARRSASTGEINFEGGIDDFIKKYFNENNTQYDIETILNPKTYFDLSVKLSDGISEISGSSGETYSAIVLLGIGRLFKVAGSERKGIKFIILEEATTIDETNFNLFIKIAEQFGYQILTMAPNPYGADYERGWFQHQLIKSQNENINLTPASYFMTNTFDINLEEYLKSQAR